MKCPYCGNYQTEVKDSVERDGYRRRRYLCHWCGQRFNTRETVYDYKAKREILYNAEAKK